jgi:hypothetical protein
MAVVYVLAGGKNQEESAHARLFFMAGDGNKVN